MARPKTHDDLPNHSKRAQRAVFYVDEFITEPTLTQLYAQFIEQANESGVVERNGSTINVLRTKTSTELDTELEDAQRVWDGSQKRYNEVASGTVEKLASYEKYGLREFAAKESLPILDAILADKT